MKKRRRRKAARNGTVCPFVGYERRLGAPWRAVCCGVSREAVWALLGERVPGAEVETSWRVLRAGVSPREKVTRTKR